MRMSGKFRGRLVNHKTGEIICWEKHNKVVKAGFNWVASLMSDTTVRMAPISHIAFGTGSNVTVDSMIVLENEVYRAPVTSNWNETTRELTFTGGIPRQSGLSVNITEVGLFNAEAGGTMFDRATFSPKGIDEDLSFDYTFIITITE